MKTIVTLAAAAALSLGLAGAASAASAGLDAGHKASEQNAGQVGYCWQRGSLWRGRCFYRYVYVSNDYRWRLRYRYRCYY